MTAAQEATMLDIANAIREKSTGAGATGPIHVSKYAERIKLIPRPATDVVRQFATYTTEQTPAQMTSLRLIRCNGFPAYEVPSTVIYDALKRDDWQIVDFPPPPVGPLTSRQYGRFFEDDDNLYICVYQANTTVLNVVNTKTGVLTEITGLPSRQYPAQGFFIVGSLIYVHGGGNWGTLSAFNTIVWINRTTFAHGTVTLNLANATAFSRPFNTCALVGHRLFFGWSGTTVATEIPFINTNVSPPTAGTVTGLPSRAHNSLFLVNNKLFIGTAVAATEISVITAGGTAPNYTTWTVSNITGLPSRIYGTISNWFLAGNFLYVGSGDDQTSVIRIQHTTAANTTTQVTGLPNRRHQLFVLVGTKIYLGSWVATTEIPVINNTNGTLLTTITDLPSRAYSRLAVVGNKIYLGSSSISNTTLPIINTTNDTFSEITGLSGTGGASVDSFLLIGTILYINNAWPFANPHIAINTVNDTRRVTISGFAGLGDAWHGNPTRITRVDRVDGHVIQDELFYTRSDRTNALAVLDLLEVNRSPGGATVNVRHMTGLPFRRPDHMVLKNDKVWMTGMTTADNGNAHNTNGINLLTKAILPNHPQPVYIRY